MRREMDRRGWTPAMIEELGKIGPKLAWAVCRAGTKCVTLEGGGGGSDRLSSDGTGAGKIDDIVSDMR